MNVVRLHSLFSPRWRTGVALGVGLALLLLGGCRSAGYYGQAVNGQWQILVDREPITGLIASTNTPAAFRQRLELFQQMRGFAGAELKLPIGRHYLSYVDLRRSHVVWNVFAAPEFSVEARTWWYPLVGRLEYRGYFAEAAAQHCAQQLAAKNVDVAVEMAVLPKSNSNVRISIKTQSQQPLFYSSLFKEPSKDQVQVSIFFFSNIFYKKLITESILRQSITINLHVCNDNYRK